MAYFLATPVRAQVSPGPLSRVHRAYDGIARCSACHSVGAGNSTFKCLDCHTEILAGLKEHTGFHSKVADLSKRGKDCASCHAEHAGEAFDIIHWEPNREAFDHKQTGYPLLGKHAGLACQQCHNQALLSRQRVHTIQGKNPQRTYLGLSSECINCHLDAHKGELGTECAGCHSLTSWRPAIGFDHQRTQFPLTGLHDKVACQKCHMPKEASNAQPRYKGIAFARCDNCHLDPHQGAFKKDCQSCHQTSGWRSVQMASAFDHNRPPFPLRGLHAKVTCIKCHQGTKFSAPLPHNRCVDCHTPDPHGGQFAQRPDHGECSGCHTENGFKPSIFTVELHQQSAFPLLGKHGTVACAKCHIPSGVATLYRLKHAACLDCHQDPHSGQFRPSPYENRCEACHVLQGFTPSTFSVARHQQTRFPLAGGHIAIPCQDCHRQPPDSPTVFPVKYRFNPLACQTCHEDPHRGQFTMPMRVGATAAGSMGCLACHSQKSWTEIVGFDHAATGFALLGAHRVVGCLKCHHPGNLALGIRDVVFKGAPTECAGCHEDIHGGQFARSLQSTNCAVCHENSFWKPARFDHEKNTTFSLAGAHQNVPCRLCHAGDVEINGKQVLVYKNAPRQCSACHKA